MKGATTMSEHVNHEAVIKRLKRAEGHLKSVITMMEQGKPCMDIAQQLHAVVALENAKVTFMESHINDCLDKAIRNPAEAQHVLKDFKTITRYMK